MRTSHNSATRSGWQVRPGPRKVCDELATTRQQSNTGTRKSNWSAEVVARRVQSRAAWTRSDNAYLQSPAAGCQRITVRACDALILFCFAPPQLLLSVTVTKVMRLWPWPAAVSSGGRICGRWCGFAALRSSASLTNRQRTHFPATATCARRWWSSPSYFRRN